MTTAGLRSCHKIILDGRPTNTTWYARTQTNSFWIVPARTEAGPRYHSCDTEFFEKRRSKWMVFYKREKLSRGGGGSVVNSALSITQKDRGEKIEKRQTVLGKEGRNGRNQYFHRRHGHSRGDITRRRHGDPYNTWGFIVPRLSRPASWRCTLKCWGKGKVGGCRFPTSITASVVEIYPSGSGHSLSVRLADMSKVTCMEQVVDLFCVHRQLQPRNG